MRRRFYSFGSSLLFLPLSLLPLSLSVRGATIEKCVEFLTDSVSHLWGGFSLKSGPRSHGNELSRRATKQQITTFFLTCYQTFVHPLILARLLCHRLATPCSQNPFDWSASPEKNSFSHADSIPAHQLATLKVIGRWLEEVPDDFLTHPQLSVSLGGRGVVSMATQISALSGIRAFSSLPQSEMSGVIQRLKLARGPYSTHCHRFAGHNFRTS